MSAILLLTLGGTPLDAMQRYDPMCKRFTLLMLKFGPSTVDTEKAKKSLEFDYNSNLSMYFAKWRESER